MTRHRPTQTRSRRLSIAAAASTASLALLLLGSTSASATADHHTEPGAVFVQLNSTSGNEIAAYARGADGKLSNRHQFATGGLGGTEVGAPLDALASQSSLVLDHSRHLLLAVNAGSNSVTAFRTWGPDLHRTSVVPSGGTFPSSIAVHGDLAYVLNAGGDGSISGFRLHHGKLVPLVGSTRSLGLGNTNPPSFISAPAQIGFSKDGRTLITTTKNHNTFLTFEVSTHGWPSAAPVVTASAGAVPFSFVVDQRGRVHVTEAGTGKTSSYEVANDGTLILLGSSSATGGAALCWNVQIGRTLYGANAGSATLSAWRIQPDGTTTLTAPVATSTGAGPIDLAASGNDRFLYVQESVAGTVGAYAVSLDGSLHRIQTVTGLPAFTTTGMEGIAAS